MSDDVPPDNVRIAPVLQLVPCGQTTKGQGYSFCSHDRSLVDVEERVVTCRDCGKTLDAFDRLLEYARGDREWQSREAECRDAAKRLAELKAEERRVKSRTASASRKDATAAVAHEQQATFVRRQAIAAKAKDIAELTRQIVRLARIETNELAGEVTRLARIEKRGGGK